MAEMVEIGEFNFIMDNDNKDNNSNHSTANNTDDLGNISSDEIDKSEQTNVESSKRKRVVFDCDDENFEVINNKHKNTKINWIKYKCFEHDLYYKNCYICNPDVECTHSINGKFNINTNCNDCIKKFNEIVLKKNISSETTPMSETAGDSRRQCCIATGLNKLSNKLSYISNQIDEKADEQNEDTNKKEKKLQTNIIDYKKRKPNRRFENCVIHGIQNQFCVVCNPTYRCLHNKGLDIRLDECITCITRFNTMTNSNLPLPIKNKKSNGKDKLIDLDNSSDSIEQNTVNEIEKRKDEQIEILSKIYNDLKCEHIDNKYMCHICTPECICVHNNSVFKCNECKQHRHLNNALEFLKKNNYTADNIRQIYEIFNNKK